MSTSITIGHLTPEGTKNFEIEIPQFGLGVFLTPSDGTCKQACLWALDAGYRHIDTAKVYGNEEEVGDAIIQSGLDRNEIFVTTKLRRADAIGYEETLNSCKKSLERLSLDYVDLYLIHAPPENISVREDVWRGMEDILESGLSRSIGVSNYGPKHLEELMKSSRYGPAVNQIELHPWLQRPHIIDATISVGAVPMAYSPLARGHKVDDETLSIISKNEGCTPAQACIKWCIDRGYITIPKSSNKDRIYENLESLNITISNKGRQALDDLEENYISGWDPTSEP